jgi:two-component sensor histidine kinase
VDSDSIRLEVDVRSPRLSVDTAIPCGLLVNELVSNSLKHAFHGRERGRICVQLVTPVEREIVLVVSDDGTGLPAGVDPQASATFGMQLVMALVSQLRGTIQVERGGCAGNGIGSGTTVRIVFPTVN